MIIEFDVPADIEAGLNSGDLMRYGGVIRDRLGNIVKHLKEVPGPASNQEAARRIAGSLNKPWAIVAVTALSAVTVGASAIIAARKREQAGKREDDSQEQAPTSQKDSVVDLRRSLKFRGESPSGQPG